MKSVEGGKPQAEPRRDWLGAAAWQWRLWDLICFPLQPLLVGAGAPRAAPITIAHFFPLDTALSEKAVMFAIFRRGMEMKVRGFHGVSRRIEWRRSWFVHFREVE